MKREIINRFRGVLTYRIITTLAGTIITVGLARLLGPDQYGLLFLSISVLGALLTFSRMGIDKSSARYISEYKDDRPQLIKTIVFTSASFIIATILAVSITLLLFRGVISGWLNEPELETLLYYGIFYIVFGTLAMFGRTILHGLESVRSASAIYAVERGTTAAAAVILVLLGYGVLGAFTGYLAGFLISTAISFYLVKLKIRTISTSRFSFKASLSRKIAEYSLPITVTSTANIIDKRIDILLVGYFLSPVHVGYYMISKQVIGFIELPASALGFSIAPSFGAEKASGDLKQFSNMYQAALIYTLLFYVPAAVGIALVAELAIPIVFGEEYSGSIVLLQILSLYVIFLSVNQITSEGLDYLGRAKTRAYAKGISSIFNLILNIILIPELGVAGAAIATVFTYGLYTSVNIFVVFAELSLEWDHIFNRVTYIIFISLAMGISVYVIVSYFTGVMGLLLGVTSGVLIWGALGIITGLINTDQFR